MVSDCRIAARSRAKRSRSTLETGFSKCWLGSSWERRTWIFSIVALSSYIFSANLVRFKTMQGHWPLYLRVAKGLPLSVTFLLSHPLVLFLETVILTHLQWLDIYVFLIRADSNFVWRSFVFASSPDKRKVFQFCFSFALNLERRHGPNYTELLFLLVTSLSLCPSGPVRLSLQIGPHAARHSSHKSIYLVLMQILLTRIIYWTSQFNISFPLQLRSEWSCSSFCSHQAMRGPFLAKLSYVVTP